MMESAPSHRRVVLGHYKDSDLLAMFTEAGVLTAIAKRGFRDPVVEIDDSEGPLTHIRLLASKERRRFLLLDACLTEVRLEARELASVGYAAKDPVDLLVVYWLREQDPTAVFDAKHQRLPLQEHPGLGVLRRAFRVALHIGRELGKDGIAASPKYFHDATIFYQSRLFLFLDPREQGRFEALLRDLASLSLGDATLALLGDAVRDEAGATVAWRPGLQVMPLGAALGDYLHGQQYEAESRAILESSRYSIDAESLRVAREVFQKSLGVAAGTTAD